MSFSVMRVNFSKIDIPKFEKLMVVFKEEMGIKFLLWPLFTLVQSLDLSLDNANIDLQDVETSFDDQDVVV